MYSSVFPIPSSRPVSNITFTYAICSQYTTQIYIFSDLFHLLNNNRNFSLYNTSILFYHRCHCLSYTNGHYLFNIHHSFFHKLPNIFIYRSDCLNFLPTSQNYHLSTCLCIYFLFFFEQLFHLFFLRLLYVVVRDVANV